MLKDVGLHCVLKDARLLLMSDVGAEGLRFVLKGCRMGVLECLKIFRLWY